MYRKPLYRKENTTARGNDHDTGGAYRWVRHARRESPASRGAMRGGRRRGLDYTPLFRFLLSRVGQPFAEVYREAAARLDRPDPIHWLVARTPAEEQAYVKIGGSTYYSGLRVDAAGLLALVDPGLRLGDMEPRCACCTHTLNGTPFTRRYRERRDRGLPSPGPIVT